ncbi:MAG: pilus assembly protein [Hellea sp.]|nr:pilus assembly protein [Hellea sp.]
MRLLVQNWLQNESGSVSVSAAFILTTFIVIFGCAAELTNAYFKTNSLQHAAKAGARIAVTSEPVASALTTMTGLEGSGEVGDPMPTYKIVCSGETQSCSQGSFNQAAFDKILYGRDNDDTCQATSKERRGMCDMFDQLNAENVTITYENSGMGRAGNPPRIIPLVTVAIANVDQDYLFLDMVNDDLGSAKLKAQAMSIGEDLK